MTGREIKEELLLLNGAVLSGEISLQALADEAGMDTEDLYEAMNVLEEVLPGMEGHQVWKAVETEDGYSRAELDKLYRETETADDWGAAETTFAAAVLQNLNLNGTIDLNPSYRYH